MIEKIKGDYYGHEIDGEIVEGYQLTSDQAKINEIIDVVNKLEATRLSQPKPNGHYPESCLSCTATHPL